jgi:RNA polymerase sigma-70 factor, ECF subfamily
LTRARAQIGSRRKRFKASREKGEQLRAKFIQASNSGNLQDLIVMLVEDATLISDGGGKVVAALNPIQGAERVSRFVLGVLSKVSPEEFAIKLVDVNGEPGIVTFIKGELNSVITFDFEDDRIRNIYIVSNPREVEVRNVKMTAWLLSKRSYKHPN